MAKQPAPKPTPRGISPERMDRFTWHEGDVIITLPGEQPPPKEEK